MEEDRKTSIDVLLEEEVERTTAELVDQARTRHDLAFPGFETVAGFIAVKLVVPAISAFISKELYERYKQIRTTREAKRALEELSARGLQPDTPMSPLEMETARVEMLASLREEGLSDEVSNLLVERVWRRVADRLARRSS